MRLSAGSRDLHRHEVLMLGSFAALGLSVEPMSWVIHRDPANNRSIFLAQHDSAPIARAAVKAVGVPDADQRERRVY